jgi:hypothetical protein
MDSVQRRGDRAIAIYDGVYRRVHGLENARSAVPPLLCVQVRRCRRHLVLWDGVALRPGDLIGNLHLSNDGVAAIHGNGRSPMAVGLEFRRQVQASLRILAARAGTGGAVADVRAFAAVTIFHRPLRRLGFDIEPSGLWWPRLTSAYQRRLLAWLHPDGLTRLTRMATPRAERSWISRERLIALYGALPGPVAPALSRGAPRLY